MPVDGVMVGDRQVVLHNGEKTRLASFWEAGPLVLVFLRHYG
jgi:hypothetical protein